MARRGRSRWVAMLRTPVGSVATALLVALLLLAVLAPILWIDQATAIDPHAILQSASGGHLFGTDSLGRDIFYRTLVATRLSVELALLATAISLVIGVLLGTAPLVLGKVVGRLVTATVNITIAFPGLLLVLFFAVVFGVGAKGAVLALGFANAPYYARLTYTLAASMAGRDFVAAARVAGVGRVRRLLRHIVPNIGEQLVVNATIGAGGTLQAFAALSFLGLGIQPPSYDWGGLLNGGLDGIYLNPLGALGPAVTIVLVGLAFNLFGETVAQAIGVPTSLASVFGDRSIPAEAAAAEPVTLDPETEPATSPATGPILRVDNLRVGYPTRDGWTMPVRGISFSLDSGQALGIVGESGSGKSLTALAVAQLIEIPGRVSADRMEFNGRALRTPQGRRERRALGLELAMVFQDPMKSFNPVKRIGRQLAEVSEQHQGMGRRAALAKATERLAAVRVPSAKRRARQYPHEYSGGMRQRAMIAMGLMGQPRLIIADEPTTALDVTVQRQILRLLDRVRTDENAAILMISHDITVVQQVCDRILVMYAGRIVEEIAAGQLRDSPRHPYTRALLLAIPDMDTARERSLTVIPGRPPEPAEVPVGCAFAARCAFATQRCEAEDPSLVAVGAGHRVACWHPQDSVLAAAPETNSGVSV